MAKFRVYEVATACYFVGEYEAETVGEAEAMAASEPQNPQPILCHQCGDEVELGDWYEFQTDKV